MPNNLKALRELYGLQQKDICAEIGVGQSTYSNYEIGITEPKISFWRAVAERYHVTLDFLLDFTDDPHGSKYGDDFILSLSEKNLVEAWRREDGKSLDFSRLFSFLPFFENPPANGEKQSYCYHGCYQKTPRISGAFPHF